MKCNSETLLEWESTGSLIKCMLQNWAVHVYSESDPYGGHRSIILSVTGGDMFLLYLKGAGPLCCF